MKTVDVYVVIRDLGYDGEYLCGIYQNKDDAEYIRDHLEAIEYDRLRGQWLKGAWNGPLEKYIRYVGNERYRLDEEVMYL